MEESILIQQIKELRKEKNAVILAHYYQIPQIQELADFVGDSLSLARQAKKVEASILVMCGVHFMAETAKIICPDKKVLIPEPKAGCSLADSCKAEDLLEWNKLDPVDDYEIHRNNLIYKNYQGNRNPFIDFPQWADYIWGTCVDGNYSATPTGSADYLNDKIASTNLKISKYSVNIAPNESISIFGTTADDSAISWTLEDDNLVSIDKTSTASLEKITITAGNKEGTTTLVASATIDGEELNKTINIKVAKVKTQAIPYLYIIIGVAVAFVLVVIFIVISSKSKKNGKGNKKIQTQMKKVATKAIKNATKSNSNSKAKKKS